MSEISHVTDTALWVAAYRAEEAHRKDALFHDTFAELLIGELGSKIATRTQGSRYTAWSVVIRTYLIDQFIMELLPTGVDTVLNLGAGLDTRPYRLDLPEALNWIEVDFPSIIDLKNEKLKKEKPKSNLQRLAIDLSNHEKREALFDQVAKNSQNVLVITEGVVPYLTNDEAKSLAQSLHKRTNFRYWISEYYSPEILKFLRTPKRLEQMKNSPFLFYPEDWFQFFKDNGWDESKTKFFGAESQRLGRTPPTPGWLKFEEGSRETQLEMIKNYLGYSIFKRQ